MPRLQPIRLLLSVVAGWIHREQAATIDYLLEENRVLREQLGKRRLRLTEDQRRRLAAKGVALGRRLLDRIVILPPNTDIDAVPIATPDPRDPTWGQVHGSHPHRDDPRAHAHGPEPGTGRRVDVPLADTMRRVDKGLRSGELRLRRDRADRGGH